MICRPKSIIREFSRKHPLERIENNFIQTTLKPVDHSTDSLRLESTFLRENDKIAFLETEIRSEDGSELFAIGSHTKFLHPRSRGMFPSRDPASA